MPNSGLDQMIDLRKYEDLARLYSLFLKVPTGLPTLKKALKDSIARRGKEINQESLATDTGFGEGPDNENEAKNKHKARPSNTTQQTLNSALKWVQDVLDLKDNFDRVWAEALNRDRELESTINEVCSLFGFLANHL